MTTPGSNSVISNKDLYGSYTSESVPAEMAAFDALPIAIRRGLNYAVDTYAAEEVTKSLACREVDERRLVAAFERALYAAPTAERYAGVYTQIGAISDRQRSTTIDLEPWKARRHWRQRR